MLAKKPRRMEYRTAEKTKQKRETGESKNRNIKQKKTEDKEEYKRIEKKEKEEMPSNEINKHTQQYNIKVSKKTSNNDRRKMWQNNSNYV